MVEAIFCQSCQCVSSKVIKIEFSEKITVEPQNSYHNKNNK
ncbi:hypothetical protein CI610_03392 [invertebrate metagenome]|uniref:Uncharacterized protein n=1 Tax=invertebrate metagenome TaxID=1711999 RepID=A0A2H9T3B3_9ZZZZ